MQDQQTAPGQLELVQIEQPQAALPAVQPPSAPAVATPGDLLRIAMATATPDLDRLERLMEMQERWERREAEKAYADAMAAFKLSPPTIVKNKGASFTGKDKDGQRGQNVAYDYADNGHVTGIIVPALAQHGFSHSWDVQQINGKIVVTCTITHRQGHSKSVTMESEADKTGSKNSIQAIGSAKSYLERYTLLAATGLAVSDGSDDDGAGAGAPDQQQPEKHPIADVRFEQTLLAIRARKYTVADCRGYYALTAEQEAKLAALEKELANV